MIRKFTILPALAFFALFIGLAALPAHAQAQQVVDANLISVGVIGEQEFADGYVTVPRVPVYWESAVPWRLSISSASGDLGISDDGSYVKPLDDFLWRISDELTWLPLRQDPEEVAWSDETGSGVIYIDIMMKLDWLEDAPGEYGADLVFTIADL